MYSPSFVSTCFVPILALMIIQIHLRSVASLNVTNDYLNHKCIANQGKYKSGSAYEKNLKYLINSTSPRNFRLGFRQAEVRMGSDTAAIFFQCRGDSYGPKCRSCFNIVVAGLQRRCPNYKAGLIWYDQCLLEFSPTYSTGRIDYENNFCMSNSKNISGNSFAFTLKWNTLIDNLTVIATDEKNSRPGVPWLYAAAKSRYGKEMMYGMVQCSSDLSNKACQACMVDSLVHHYDCLEEKRGGRVIGRSCSFRYEFYPFLNTKTGPKTYLNI